MKTLHLFAALGMTVASVQAVTLAQTNVTNDSGTADRGQEIRLDSTIFSAAPAYTLESATFYKGDLGSTATTIYLDIYVADALGEIENDIDTNLTGLTYLGSSTNGVDYASATQGNGSAGTLGDALVFSFSGIQLPVDRDVFLIFSTSGTGAQADFVGVSTATNTVGVPGSAVYTNITNSDSDPLFAGIGDASDQDHVYTLELTAVPEPSAALLGGLGLLCLLRRRRS